MVGVWKDASKRGEVVIDILCVDDVCLDTAPESIQIPSLVSLRQMKAIWNRLRILKKQFQVQVVRQEGVALFQRLCEAYDKGEIGENEYKHLKERVKIAIERKKRTSPNLQRRLKLGLTLYKSSYSVMDGLCPFGSLQFTMTV